MEGHQVRSINLAVISAVFGTLNIVSVFTTQSLRVLVSPLTVGWAGGLVGRISEMIRYHGIDSS